MRATKLREPMECPCCGEQFSAEDAETMEQHVVTPYDGDVWKCGNCETIYEDRDEAKECCR